MSSSAALGLIVVILFPLVRAISDYHLKDFAVYEKTLSVTSFAYYPTPTAPEWVDHILGSRAVFFHQVGEFGSQYGGIEAVKKARQNFEKYNFFPLPNYAYWPECSIELLGFVPLGIEEPFRGRKDRHRSGTGTATLTVTEGPMQGLQIGCYYRALYENWRKEDHNSTFWTVPFYCPAQPGKNFCTKFKEAFDLNQQEKSGSSSSQSNSGEISLQLSMTLPNYVVIKGVTVAETDNTWEADFIAFRDAAYESRFATSVLQSPADRNSRRGHYSAPGFKYAVCTVWSYSTSDPSKVIINQALIYEFLRYYANLGILLMVYDRAGNNMRGVMDTDYAKANPQRGLYKDAIDQYLVYHNWTIHGLLHGDKEGEVKVRWDQGQRVDDTGLVHQDTRSDRALTYSHCRFEAKEKYGINKVIATDFDEFLYCPGAPAVTPQSQAALIHRYLSRLAEEGRDQVSFGKTATASKATPGSTLQDCVYAELAKNKNSAVVGGTVASKAATSIAVASPSVGATVPVGGDIAASSTTGSIFNCFGSVDYVDNIQYIKSVHLTHHCPFTSRHHSCSPCPIGEWNCTVDKIKYNQYDCLCDSAQLIGQCHFVHMSIIDAEYSDLEKLGYSRQEVLRKPSEVWRIANAHGSDSPSASHSSSAVVASALAGGGSHREG